MQLFTLGFNGLKDIELVTDAIRGMSAEQAVAVITTSALTEKEQIQVLVNNGLFASEEEAKAAILSHSAANLAEAGTTEVATAASTKFNLVLKGLWKTILSNPYLAVGAAILVAVTAVKKFHEAQEQARQDIIDNAENAKSAIDEINTSLDKTTSVVEKSGKRFAELSQGVNRVTGQNKTLSNEEYNEFLNISNELAEVFPTLSRNYDENGNAIINLSGDVDTVVGSLSNLLDVQKELANAEMAAKLPDIFKGAKQTSDDFNNEIAKIQNNIDVLNAGLSHIELNELGHTGMNHLVENDEDWNTSVLYTYNDSIEEWGDSIERYRNLLDDLKLSYQEFGSPSDGDLNTTFVIDWAGMSDEQVKQAQAQIRNGFSTIQGQYNLEIDQLNREIKTITDKNKANWNGVIQYIMPWLESDYGFQKLIGDNGDMRVVVQNMINAMDFSQYSEWEDVESHIQSDILGVLSGLDEEAQNAFIKIFNVDFATATLNDYYNAIKPYLTAIALALGKTEEEVAKMFNLDDEIADFNALATKRNAILSNYSDYQSGGYKGLDDWLDSLSADDLEIVYKISTEYTSEKVKDQLEAYQDGGEVNLFLRPKVDNSELKKAGWDVSDDGYATVFTGTYSNTAGTIAANFTPILTDENGNYKGVLSPDEFTRYCEDVLDGVREDDLKLQIGATFDGENAIEEADKAAGEIHILQDYLYDLGDPSNFNLDKWAYALNQFKSAAAEPLSAFNELLNDKGTAKDPHFIDKVDDYLEKMNKLNDAYKKASENDFETDNFNKLIRDFPTLATRSDDLTVAINELKAAMNEEIDAEFLTQLEKMPTDEDASALLAYRNSILDVGKTVSETSSRLASDNGKTQKIISNMTKLQTLISSQKQGQSVALDTFNADEFKDYKSALEYVNGAIRINKEKVVEITKAKAKEQIAINKSNKAMSQTKYLENARIIQILSKSLKQAKTEQEQFNYQTQINELKSENAVIADACNQYDYLSRVLQEATDSYQHWLNAASASDYGDIMSDTEDAIKLINDTLDKTSDVYGQFGSTKYQAALDLVIPDSIDRDKAQAVEKYMNSLKKYFYFEQDDDKKPKIAGMDIAKFIQDSVNAGLMVFDSAKQEYKIAGGKTMESFAEGLKLSSGMVRAFFDEMQLYGGKFDWSDELGKSIDELYSGIEDLNSLPHFKDITLKLDFSDISTAEGQIKAIDDEIQKVNKIKATPNIDSSELQYANDILVYLTQQKQQLTAPAIMSVDTSQVDEKYQEAIGLAQEYQNTLDTKELYAIKGLDTKDLDKKLAETEQEIKGINPKIKTELNLDTTSKDGIETFIKNFDPNKYPKIVNFKANTDEVDNARKEVSKPVDVDVNYIPHDGDLPNIDTNIDVNVHYHVDGDVDVPGYAQGTAHASGTAKIGGDWGTAKGGKTLVGELGRKYFASVYSDIYYKFI